MACGMGNERTQLNVFYTYVETLGWHFSAHYKYTPSTGNKQKAAETTHKKAKQGDFCCI